MKNKKTLGHIAAFITIMIWGTTFISTKILLEVFTPIEILFIRFLLGYIILWIIYPKRLSFQSFQQEKYFILAGLSGITLYYLFENIALTYTRASNVGVIISVAPFFTVIFACLFLQQKRPQFHFFLGFIIAMIGISIISFTQSSIQINPLGDILAIIAAIIWAGYSTITKKISQFNLNTIQTTRRTFFYGLIFMIPVLLTMDFQVNLSQFNNLTIIANLIFLGVGASALCFVTWNTAVKILGSVKTSVYIYIVPVITAIISTLILKESMTWITITGIILTLIGLFLSEQHYKKTEDSIYELTE